MPAWGLTKEMRRAKPWGLDEKLLMTKKVIRDPIHGDIFITELERRVIDSPPFQRLRRIRQLGMTHLVYPGATHTRFAHSLGSLAMAQTLMDAAAEQDLGPHPQPNDLFEEWRAELGYGDDFDSEEYDRRLGEATVLARLGALLHDLTHVPFGHSLEDDLELLDKHDENTTRLDRLWSQFDEDTRVSLESEGLADFLKPLIVAPKPSGGDNGEIPKFNISAERARQIPNCDLRAAWYDFVRDIIGNTICADLLDYLHRDHFFSGLPFAVGDRYLAYFYVTPIRGEVHYPARMVLRIQRDNVERRDVVTELLKHLRYRYELSERALVHHAKLAADAMAGKALEMWSDMLWRELALARPEAASDLASETDIGNLKRRLEESSSPQVVDEVTKETQGRLEIELSRRGDDALLEWLRDTTASTEDGDAEPGDKRRLAVTTLATELLDRRLFERIGEQSDVPIPPKQFYNQFGVKDKRRRCESAAADYAGLDHSWKVLLWIPAHTMRLKVAGVLVDNGSEIRRFVDFEGRGEQRGADIYRAHEHLWTAYVFAHRTVSDDAREVILAYLAAEMGVKFRNLEDRFGPQPADWPDRLAALRECERQSRGTEDAIELFNYVRGQRAARGPEPPTFALLQQEFRHAAEAFFET